MPELVRNEQIKLFAGMLDRVGTVCLAVGVVTPTSAFLLALPQMPVVNVSGLIGSLVAWTVVFVVLHGADSTSWRACAMTAFEFFVLYGLPLLIGTAGVLAAYLFRRHMRRADMRR